MEKDKALTYALKLLSMRMHSEREMARKLYAKKFPRSEIQSLLECLKAKKLLNDSAFVRSYAEELRGKAVGDIRIRFELKRKGIAEKTIEACFEKESPEDQRKRASTLAELKLKPKSKPDPKERKRLYDFLVRKGFDYEVCRDVTRKLARVKDEEAWD